jgi:hypothetical protein
MGTFIIFVISISFGNINYRMAFFLHMPVLLLIWVLILVMDKQQQHNYITHWVFHYQPWVYYILVIIIIIGFV